MEMALREARILPRRRGPSAAPSRPPLPWYHACPLHMADSLRSYGVKEQESAGTISPRCRAERLAFTPSSTFSATEIGEFRSRLDEILREQRDQFGSERLEQIGDEFTARCPLVEDPRSSGCRPIRRLALRPTARRLRNTDAAERGGQPAEGATYRPLLTPRSAAPTFFSGRLRSAPCSALNSGDLGAPWCSGSSRRAISIRRGGGSQASERGPLFVVFDSMLSHRAGHNRSGQIRRQ
jgi:hypothetical protein